MGKSNRKEQRSNRVRGRWRRKEEELVKLEKEIECKERTGNKRVELGRECARRGRGQRGRNI